MNNYKELKVWQKAVDLAVDIYETTQSFPGEEKFGLTSQIRRCAVSIPSNIAEGSGRNTKKDFNNFLGISYGSSCELETQLLIARKTGLLNDETFEKHRNQIDEIQKMNFALKRSLTTQDSRLTTQD